MNKLAVELLDAKEACGPHPGAAPAAKGRKSAPRRSRMTRSADVDVADMVQRAAVGDRDAWEMLVAQYRPLVLSIANRLRLTPEQSADVVQDTWLQLFQHIGSIRDPARLAGWLATTARNNSLAIIRRNVKDRALQAAEHCSADVDDANPVVALVRSERHAALVRALRRLPTREQELLTLLCAAGPPSYREISRRLGIPIGSIGPTRRRALTRLRAELLKDPRVDRWR